MSQWCRYRHLGTLFTVVDNDCLAQGFQRSVIPLFNAALSSHAGIDLSPQASSSQTSKVEVTITVTAGPSDRYLGAKSPASAILVQV